MIRSAKNSYNVLIGKSVARTASVQITDPSASSTYIADGEIVVLNHLDQPLTAGQTISDSPFIRLVQRSGSQLIFSARIDGQRVMSYKGKSGAAAQEQIYVLGYNGTSGSIDLTTAAKLLKITFKHDQRIWSEQPFRRVYQSSGTTQVRVATDMATIMNQDSLPALMGTGAAGSWISAEILCNNAGTAITGTGTITVRKGSAVITAGTDIDAVMAVNDYIRINSTATTGSMYKIISMDTTANTATLNMPYQGASATVAEASNEYVTAANMATAACGIKMTGLPLTSGIPPYSRFEYSKVAFIVHPGDGFGSTDLTKTQEMSLGNGVFEQVRQIEYMSIKFEGAQNESVHPLPTALRDLDAVSGTLYDTISISYADASDMSVISGTKPSEQELLIFLADGASQQGTLRGQLNPWMASTPKGLANLGAL